MRPQPEAVLELAATIVDLKKQLSAAQQKWDLMFPEIGNRSITISQKGGRSESNHSGAGKIRLLLNGHADTTWTADDVATNLALPMGTTRTTLSKMVKKGIIEKRGFNGYGAIRTKEKETTSEEIAS